jgi:hypothetical protein
MFRRTHIATDNTIDLRQRRRRTHAAWPASDQNPYAEDRVPRLAVVRPVAKTALTPGTVVWAHVPYEETDGYKLRPAIVSHLSGRDVTLFPATTSGNRHRYSTIYRELVDLGSAGLRRATGVERAGSTIDVIDVVSVAGVLGADDELAIFGPGAVDGEAGLAAAA